MTYSPTDYLTRWEANSGVGMKHPSRSFDAITTRAVSRMCAANAKGDWSYIARIHEKARNLRAHRAAVAFIGSLRRPLLSQVAA